MLLHDEDVPELIDLDAFMQSLQEHFEDLLAACCAEAHIRALKQGKQSVMEYIQDFRRLASHLWD